MSVLLAEQFDAAELETRRLMASRDFFTYDRAVLEFILERSFRLRRTAAFFRSYRHLGRLIGLSGGHAHDGLKLLLVRRVVFKVWPNWYGINVIFDQWDVPELQRPPGFEDEPPLPWEPALSSLLTEVFVGGQTNLPGAARSEVARATVDLGRDAGPAPDETTARAAAGSVCPPSDFSQPENGPVNKPSWADYCAQMRAAVDNPALVAELTGLASATAGTGVPENGTPRAGPVFRRAERSEKRNTANPNPGAGLPRAVPENGTFIVAGPAEPAEPAGASIFGNGLPANKKPEAAWRWLQSVDTSRGLAVSRFEKQWLKTCEQHPDYVLNVLPGVLARQTKRVQRPLALLAEVARRDRRLR